VFWTEEKADEALIFVGLCIDIVLSYLLSQVC
jgi:hypothetical protein